MDWLLMPLRRYADFQGRSRRKEYWMFALGILIAYVILAVLAAMLVGSSPDPDNPLGGAMAIPILLFVAAIFIPSLAVQVRRFHDQDKSGWMVLLGLIPFVGGVILLVFMCLEGTAGPNRFGPDPKANERGPTGFNGPGGDPGGPDRI